jgi:hypothetical protein
LGYQQSPFFYNGYIYLDARGKESEINIGENTIINNNACLVADNASINIGKTSSSDYLLKLTQVTAIVWILRSDSQLILRKDSRLTMRK